MIKNKSTLQKEKDSGESSKDLSSLSRASERETMDIFDGGGDEPKSLKGPDGKEYLIREVKELNTSGLRLFAAKREGYHRVWAIDREPDQLQEMVDRGFRFIDNQRKVRGGSRTDGTSYYHYLMEVPVEIHNKVTNAEQEKISSQEMQILNPDSADLKVPEGQTNEISRKSRK